MYQSTRAIHVRRWRQPRVSLTEIASFFTLTCLNWVLAAILDSGVVSLSSFGLFIWLSLLILRADQIAFILLAPFLINRLSVAASLIFIEYGGYIPELGIFGEPGIASASHVFYSALFFLSFVFFLKWMTSSSKSLRQSAYFRSFDRFALFFAIGIIVVEIVTVLYLLGYGAATGFPLLTGTDRFVYRRYSGSVLLLNILNIKFIFAIFLGMVSFSMRVPRLIKVIGVVVFLIQTMVFFLYGDKFFTIASNAAFFMMPLFITKRISVNKIIGIGLPTASVLVGTLFCVTYYVYSEGFTRSSYETFNKLSERMTAQAELWFIANSDNPQLIDWNQDIVDKQIGSFFAEDADQYVFQNGLGTFYFSSKYAPMRIFASMLTNNGTTSFTMGWEPLGLVTFGYLGLVPLMLLTGFVVALTGAYLRWAIISQSHLSIIFATFMIVLMLYITNQGTPHLLFNFWKIKNVAIFGALELVIFIAVTAFTTREIRSGRLPFRSKFSRANDEL